MLIISPAAFTTWIDMVPLVTEHCAGCPIPLAMEHLRDAARDFFERSRVWRSGNVTLFTTTAGTSSYTYTAPTNGEVHAVQSAWINGDPLQVIEPGEAEDDDPDSDGDDDFKLGARQNTLYTSPAPETTGLVVKGTLSFTLSDAAVGIPTPAYSQWRRQIAAGAAAQLVAQANKPWSNPNAAAYLSNLFETALMVASNEAGPIQGRPMRVRPV